MMYTVAMLKKDDDLQLVTIVKGIMSFSYANDLKEIEDLQNSGYTLESCIMTNKKEVFYKNKLKGRIAEYQNYLKHSHNTLKEVIEKHSATGDVYTQTAQCVYEYRATLKKQIAMCAVQCLDLGVPVNELALDCIFDYNRELERGAR